MTSIIIDGTKENPPPEMNYVNVPAKEFIDRIVEVG
jgi:hypothetical protein